MDEAIKSAKKKKRWPFVLGTVILIFAVVGAAFTVQSVIGLFADSKSNTDEYAEYADYLTWVVGVDPDGFSDITKADNADLLNIAVCSLLTDEVKTGQYEITDAGLKVPATDVEVRFIDMFGTDVKPVHASVVGYGYQFTYDPATASYTVPLTGVAPPFTPRIISDKRTGGLITLTVGYVGTSNIEVAADGTVAAAQPDKYREITLREASGSLLLISITDLSLGEYQ